MALSNLTLLSQIAGYVIALILSVCMTVPLSMHQDEFRGHCLLFSTGIWQEDDGQFSVDWASQAYCNYGIFVGVTLFVTSAIQIYRLSMFMYKGNRQTCRNKQVPSSYTSSYVVETVPFLHVDSSFNSCVSHTLFLQGQNLSFVSAFVDVVTSTILCIMTIIAALMITLGFLVWCDEMTKRFPSCEVAAGKAIDKKDHIDTTGFHIEMGTAQFGAWASWACWVGLAVLALLKMCRYHQIENMRVSMFRERQRLVNENAATLDRTDDNGSKPSTLSRA